MRVIHPNIYDWMDVPVPRHKSHEWWREECGTAWSLGLGDAGDLKLKVVPSIDIHITVGLA